MQNYTDDCFAGNHAAQTDMQNIENNFACLKSAFSGVAQPADMVAGMWWYDTTANILKLRNEANNAWQSVWDFASNKPVIANLSNEITGAMIAAAVKDPVAGTAGLRTLGAGAQQAARGNDARLSDERVPTNGSVIEAKLGANACTLSKIKKSVSEYSTDIPSEGIGLVNLPDNYYCFFPKVKGELSVPVFSSFYITTTATYQSPDARFTNGDLIEARTAYTNTYYLSASGEVAWLFIMRDRETKEIESMGYLSDHPCFGTGIEPKDYPHPFRLWNGEGERMAGLYDPNVHEIVVVNPLLEDTERYKKEAIQQRKSPLEIIKENYEIDEDSSPPWPNKKVSIGLPQTAVVEGREVVIDDWRFIPEGFLVETIKEKIPKPSYVKVKSLRRKR